MTVGDLIRGYLVSIEAEGAKVRNIRYQVKPVLAALGSLELADLKTSSIEAYRIQRAKEKSNRGSPLSQSTINRELVYLRAALRRAQEDEVIDRVPRFRMRKETGERRDWWTQEQLDGVMAALRVNHPCLADLIEFYSLTGWRKREALGLRWEQVDFERGVIRLLAERTKELEPRVLPIVGGVAVVLERRRKDRRAGCDFVFHRDGVERKDFRRAWDTARAAIGCENLLHGLRRTMARRYLLAKYPVELIMKIGGWRSREMVERYAQLETEDLKAAMLDVENKSMKYP